MFLYYLNLFSELNLNMILFVSMLYVKHFELRMLYERGYTNKVLKIFIVIIITACDNAEVSYHAVITDGPQSRERKRRIKIRVWPEAVQISTDLMSICDWSFGIYTHLSTSSLPAALKLQRSTAVAPV